MKIKILENVITLGQVLKTFITKTFYYAKTAQI